MNSRVEVVCNVSNDNNTRTITLRRGNEIVTCNEVLFWDDEAAEYVFDEWMEYAAEDTTSYIAV